MAANTLTEDGAGVIVIADFEQGTTSPMASCLLARG
jgi:hypothetical protein